MEKLGSGTVKCLKDDQLIPHARMRQGQKRCATASTITTRAAAATIIDCEGTKLGAALVLVGGIELEGPEAAITKNNQRLKSRYRV